MAGSTVHLAVSPRLIEFTCSPGCKATSHTWSTAQTMLGCCAPYTNLMAPPEPATGLMPVADPASHRLAMASAARS